MKLFSLIFFFVFSLSLLSYSQQNNTIVSEKEQAKIEKKAARKAKKAEKIAQGKFIITPIGIPGYSPELGGFIAGGGLMTFKTNPKDSLIQRSSFPVTIAYSTTNAIIITGLLNSFWYHDKIRIIGDFWYKNMTDNYWGIGFDKGAAVPKTDSITAYHRQWMWINPRVLFQWTKNYFVGANIDYAYTKGSRPSAGVAADSNYLVFNNKPLSSGLGFILRYDSRDVPVDHRTGFLIDLRSTFYTALLGGDNTFQVYLLDYRHAVTFKRKNQVLAWQLKSRFAVGDIPYGEMSQVGTPFDLRGYTWGRYRDKDMAFVLAEYRYKFLKRNGKFSMHSLVTWAGTGTVFDVSKSNKGNIKFLPNIGIGYRIEVQPRMNIRIDFGIGRESSGVYFNFSQAF